jgi:hypothetical protein
VETWTLMREVQFEQMWTNWTYERPICCVCSGVSGICWMLGRVFDSQNCFPANLTQLSLRDIQRWQSFDWKQPECALLCLCTNFVKKETPKMSEKRSPTAAFLCWLPHGPCYQHIVWYSYSTS